MFNAFIDFGTNVREAEVDFAFSAVFTLTSASVRHLYVFEF